MVKILIVDDDVDSALLVDSVFSRLGCSTTCSLNSLDARHKICTHRNDIIILDWVLDRHMDGGQIVEDCKKLFDKFGDTGFMQSRPKVITYSSLDESEIGWKRNPYFDHLAHWKKPIRQREMLSRALHLLLQVGG